MLKIIFSLATIYLSNFTFSQSFSHKEIASLHSIIVQFLKAKDEAGKVNPARKSEFNVIFFEIDSMARVKSISVLSDVANKDSTSSFLSQMQPLNFISWTGKAAKGKTLILPVLSIIAGLESGYVDKIPEIFPVRRLSVMNETRNTIVLDALYYTPRHIIPEAMRE